MIADAYCGYLFTINNNHSIMTRDVDAESRGSRGSGLIFLFLRSDSRQPVRKGIAGFVKSWLVTKFLWDLIGKINRGTRSRAV